MSRRGETVKTAHLLHEMIIALTGIDTLFTARDPMIPDYNKALLEPSEADLMQRILKFGKYYGEIEKYISSMNSQRLKNEKIGLYLITFTEALNQATQPYWNTVVSLEEEITQNSQCSLHFVWSKIYVHYDLLTGLKRIVNDVEKQKLRGCMLLEYLQDTLYSSVGMMRSAVQLIIEALNKIFYHQILCWMVYGQLVDSYDEFFIKENSPSSSSVGTPFENFSINLQMLPKFITHSLAGKILQIGQTVLFLRSNPYMTSCEENIDSKTDICITDSGIIGSKEKEIQRKIQEIQNMSTWNEGGAMDRLVGQISSCVTQQLWSLADQDSRLIDQLKLVKEFFLLGRGELFHEFVMQVDQNFTKGLAGSNESTIDSDLNSILQEAAQKILMKEDFLQRFKLEYRKTSNEEKTMNLGGEWTSVTVKYDIPWPLQLLFTPGVLTSYNKIFQFLLRLKKIQVKLVNCWLFEKTKKIYLRSEDNVRRRVLHRNLWFLINNLQYYLHVDVLESQFTIFESALKNSKDFDEIQKAHTIFVQNLVGQLFIYDEEGSNTSKISINRSMNKILKICEEYCHEVEVHEDREIEETKIKCMLLRFESCVECLLKVLARFSSEECYPGSQYLSQFLLRLDYNSFFTQQISSDMIMIYL